MAAAAVASAMSTTAHLEPLPAPAMEMPKVREPEEVVQSIEDLFRRQPKYFPGFKKLTTEERHQMLETMKTSVSLAKIRFLSVGMEFLSKNPTGYHQASEVGSSIGFLNSQQHPELDFVLNKHDIATFYTSKKGIKYKLVVHLTPSEVDPFPFHVFHSVCIVPGFDDLDLITHTVDLALQLRDSTYAADRGLFSFDYKSQKSHCPKLCWITPFYSEGDLFDYLDSHNLSRPDRAQFACASLEKLCAMHRDKLVYGDFKLENLFLDAQLRLFLGDFESVSDPSVHSFFGTPLFCAPEVWGALLDHYLALHPASSDFADFNDFVSTDSQNLLKTYVSPNVKQSIDIWSACLVLLQLLPSLQLYLPTRVSEQRVPFIAWFCGQILRYEDTLMGAASSYVLNKWKQHEAECHDHPLPPDQFLLPPDPSHPLHDLLETIRQGFSLAPDKRPTAEQLLAALRKDKDRIR